MNDIDTMHIKAAARYEEKDLQGALELYKQIIETMCPADEVALSCIMDIYLELDDKFNYYLARANVNIAQNKLDWAINDTKKAIELDLDNIDARRKLARLYKVADKRLKAIDEFLKILELDNKQLDAYFELAELYMTDNAIESAISIARSGIDLFPDEINLKNMLAQLYFKANDFKSALEFAADEMLRIKIMLQDEQNKKAKELLDKIDYKKLDENQKTSYHILKAQYLYNTKDFEKALYEVEEFSKLAKPNAISFQMKALIYEELKDEFQAHLNWGFCYKAQGKFDEAIVEFDNAYHENPQNKTVLIELANLYAQNKERYVSMEFWQKVYDIDKDEQAREVLAEFYYSEGNFQKAEEFGKVIEKKEKKEAQEEQFEGLLDKVMRFFTRG